MPSKLVPKIPRVSNLGKRMRKYLERQRVQPMHQCIDDLDTWFKSPLGQKILKAEQQLLSEELSYLFGYHLMNLSVVSDHDIACSSRINHSFSLSPKFSRCQSSGDQAVAEFEALPLADETVDLTILHHVLEFSENPHQLLKEASRVTISRGHILIFAFNPNSLMGLFKPLAQTANFGAIWRRSNLRASRVKDWLEFLDFSCRSMRYGVYNLPLNNHKFLSSSGFVDRLMNKTGLPFGSVYCILARKDKVGLTPVKQPWVKTSLIDAVPIPKRPAHARGPSVVAARIRHKNNDE